LKRSIKITNKYFILLFILISIGGCSKESPKKNYIARVNNSYLTADEFNSLVDSSNQNFYKNEIIRNWVNKELLYQKALKDGITDNKNFERILTDTKKELAVTLFLDKVYAKEKVTPVESEIEEYYKQNKNDYKLFYDAYVVNIIDFSNEDNAVKFRTSLLGSNWNKTVNVYKGDTSILDIKSSRLYYAYELEPTSLTRIVKELNQDEISIVFSDYKDVYTVVQLVQKIEKGTVPPLGFIKGLVKKRLEAQKKEEFLKNYIKELYSKNNIEVKNQE
jgi:hypothetical protein